MMVFDLKCAKDHQFEAWFPSTGTFEKQAKSGAVACPVCGDTKIEKALMAPSVSGTRKKGRDGNSNGNKAAMHAGQYMAALKELRQQVEKNCDYVGEKFPEEARKIHYGETETRNIYGEASDSDARDLQEEGVEFQRIPVPPEHDA